MTTSTPQLCPEQLASKNPNVVLEALRALEKMTKSHCSFRFSSSFYVPARPGRVSSPFES
jgi:hypothetical protein